MGVRLLFFAMLAGCALDEAGDFESQDAAAVDVVVQDAATNDVTGDVTSSDAGADVTQQDVTSADAPTEAAVDAGYDAGPILTITGGTYTLLGADAGACSLNSNNATSFELVNDRDASVDLVWVDFTCVEQPYGTITAAGQKPQNTYETHVWRIRNDADKSLLAAFVLGSSGPFTVTVH